MALFKKQLLILRDFTLSSFSHLKYKLICKLVAYEFV